MQEGSIEGIAWRASLLTFENEIYPLNESWVVSGLGHDYTIDTQPINTASVLHYNGKMKPWLDLGIPQYKSYWKKFLNKEDQLLRWNSQCLFKVANCQGTPYLRTPKSFEHDKAEGDKA
ncbi:Putative galacturonosyltransferase 7 [Glycine soja]|uniref:Hexosyltransferase n=1 Tax=Glycine soja TaxID=3848 RepID=A0A0B2PAA8_GLYSO|nr:Putative galacturonosyltransferase 7 [Glycine soja]